MDLKTELKTLQQIQFNYDIARYWQIVIKQELNECNHFLNPNECKTFKNAYKRFILSDSKGFLYRQDRYAQAVQFLIDPHVENINILDAGCGTGSESILCGIFGANVTGIDLSDIRVAIANKRLDFYNRQLDRNLAVNFYAQSIFDFPNKLFDIIWVKQAISHIEPADKFLKLCYDHLKQKGKLIINDGNAFNPYALLQAKKDQNIKGGTYTIKKDPRTGKNVSYAQERLFSISSIKKLMKSVGFNIEKSITYTFIPPVYLIFNGKPIAFYVDRIVARICIIQHFGVGYVAVAVKN